MFVFLALLLAILLSAFQYLYKRKALLFFVLRSLTYFSIFLLLLNLKVEKSKETITKPNLYILADDTQSIKKQNVDNQVVSSIKLLQKSDLKNKFSVHYYQFSNSLSVFDSLHFKEKQTNIASVLSALKDIHQSDHVAPVILISDGISNIGNDYLNTIQTDDKLPIYPLVVGDTTHHTDTKIDLLNVNSFVYKGNKFPVEIFASYSGNRPVDCLLKIKRNKTTVFKKKLHFSLDNKSVRVEALLPSGEKGLHKYSVSINPIADEKNTLNNYKSFVIEVIDNAQKILIVSEIIHPDLGAIKRNLSQNKYLQLKIVKPQDKLSDFNTYHTFILYQPTTAFTSIIKKIKVKKKPWFMITGSHTDWHFVNAQKLFFTKNVSSSTEDYVPITQNNFALFKLPDLQVTNFPPLRDYYGAISFNTPSTTAYLAQIKGINTNQPLLSFNSQEKQAVLFGENIWQWSMQSGIEKQQDNFSRLLQQVIQYLSINQDYQRLKIQYKNSYFQGDRIQISAQFLNKNLEFDDKVNPYLIVKTASGTQKYPMSLQNDFYVTDVSNLPAGSYRFTVFNADKSLVKSGLFSVLAFNSEDNILRADADKLQSLADLTNGKLTFGNATQSLINTLQNSNNYHSISKLEVTKSPLIDYKYLLFFIVFLLSLEWLLKKLRGEL